MDILRSFLGYNAYDSSVAKRTPLPEIDRSSKLSPEEEEIQRLGHALSPPTEMYLFQKQDFPLGEGPFPVIDPNPSLNMTLSNINKWDLLYGIGLPFGFHAAHYWYYKDVVRWKNYRYSLIISLLIAPTIAINYSYGRLAGRYRNDDEAEHFLGWKRPIYYDSDFLLGTPEDAGTGTVVTQRKERFQYYSNL